MRSCKRLFAGLLASIFFMLPMWVGAAGPSFVFDDGNLFSAEEAGTLEESLAAASSECPFPLYVATTSYAGGKSAREYADDFYDYGGLGYGADHSGALLLIDMDNREAYITTTGQAISIYSDSRIDALLDVVVPKLKKQDYYGAAAAFLSKAKGYALSGAAGDAYEEDYGLHRFPLWQVALAAGGISLAAAGIFFGAVCWKYAAKRKDADYPFRQQSGVQILQSEDRFINKTIITRRIPQNTGSGGSGGSSTHTSSSGTSHGGGGRGF